MRARSRTVNCSVNWLKTRNSPRSAGCMARNLDATDGVADVQKSARLSSLAVHRQRVADGRFRAEAIQRRAKNFVVIETVNESFIESGFVRHGTVNHTLIQVGRAQSPRLAGEHDVMAVMHLRKVIEGAGLLRDREARRGARCVQWLCSPLQYRYWECRIPPWFPA